MSAPTRRRVSAQAPEPGRGPVMVPAVGLAGAPTPLISEEAHTMICGFTSSVAHPQDPTLAQCTGCRLWRRRPPGRGLYGGER